MQASRRLRVNRTECPCKCKTDGPTTRTGRAIWVRNVGGANSQTSLPIAKAGQDAGIELTKEVALLAMAGTGYGLIGILVIILLVVLIIYFVRWA